MFENLGKKIQTGMLVFIIVLLSLVMGIIGFGTPGSEGGCTTDGPTYAAQVYGETISEGEFRAAYIVTGFNRYPIERAQTLRLREYTLDGLIERTLLVREADRLGLTADADDVIREAARDEIVLLGAPVGAPDGYPSGRLQQNFRDSGGNLSTDRFEAFIRNYLRRSVQEFVTWQVEETRAALVRDMVTSSVAVSPREVWDAYVQETDRAQLSYFRFDPAYFQEHLEVTDEAIEAWMGEHAEEVDAEYRRQRHRYTGLEEQTHARHILIDAPASASEEDRAAARARAEGLLAQAQSDGDFAALARENSGDEGSAARGGDLGWFPRGRMVPPFEEAAFGAEPVTIVAEVVESQFGFHVIEVLGRREGDVPEAEAKREISDALFREARAGELAREAADRALAYLSDGHTDEELDERLLHDWAEPEAEAAEGEEPEAAEDEEPAEELAPTPERGSRAPQRRETYSFGRSERAISGPFDSGPLTQAAFEMDLDAPLPDAPVQLGESWFVYRLIERTTADEEGFEEATQTQLRDRLLAQKSREALDAYIGGLRARAEAEQSIRINHSILSYGDDDDDDDDGESEEPTTPSPPADS